MKSPGAALRLSGARQNLTAVRARVHQPLLKRKVGGGRVAKSTWSELDASHLAAKAQI